jgi:hypothetical protein
MSNDVPVNTETEKPTVGPAETQPNRLQRFGRRIRKFLQEPPWWFREIFAATLVGIIVAAVTIYWQKSITDEDTAQARRLENLRFVRQLSSEKDVVARPFAQFDLEGQNLAGLDLRGADFTGASLQQADLFTSDLSPRPPTATTGPGHSTLASANLTNAHLNFANLSGAFMPGADLSGAHLDYANLSGAAPVDVNLSGANLNHADLSGANLTHAHLSGADLDEANLSGANLERVNYDEKTKWPVGFTPPPSSSLPF